MLYHDISLLKTCRSPGKIEEAGTKHVLDLLKEFGGWPVLEGDSWNDGAFSWKESVYKFREAGFSVDYFIDFSVGTDLKNSSSRIIDVSLASKFLLLWSNTLQI